MMFLSRLLRFSARERLSVFLFHKVPAFVDPLVPQDIDIAGFINVMDFVEQHFQVLPLSDAVTRLQAGKLDRGCACITFDDGYYDWADGVVDVLERRSLPATFFITTGQLFGRPMWHERLANVVRIAEGDTIDTVPYRLPALSVRTLRDKQAAIRALEFHFKYLPVAVRDHYLAKLEEAYGADPSDIKVITQEQLRDISARGFEIGSHTLEHPILSLCDAARAKEEIGNTREILEGIIQSRVTAFAYPNGRPYVDFTRRHIAMAKECGYTYAVTTQWGAATKDTPVFQIPRFTPWGPDLMHMSVQVIRNLFSKAEYIGETA